MTSTQNECLTVNSFCAQLITQPLSVRMFTQITANEYSSVPNAYQLRS